MKKVFCIVLSFLFCLTAFTYCLAEEAKVENPFTPNEEPTYYICRPNVKCRSLENKDQFETLHFGEKVKILQRRGEITNIEYSDGKKGYVTTGFIVETYYPMLYISIENPVYLAAQPGLDVDDFGFGACGQRWEERAIVLFEQDGYLFIVTEEGFSGYTRADAPGLLLYVEE